MYTSKTYNKKHHNTQGKPAVAQRLVVNISRFEFSVFFDKHFVSY